MNFATDRDLLALEPTLFNDVPFITQQRLHVTDADVTGSTLTSLAADFIEADVEAGSVVLIAGVAHEVIARVNANTLTVSQLRTSLADNAIAPAQGTGFELYARTFALQTALVHESLLQLLGIDRDNPDNTLTENSVVSLTTMARLESLGSIERIYASALALTGDNDGLQFKAASYRQQFREAQQRATVLIDVNGDGHPQERRTLGSLRLRRI